MPTVSTCNRAESICSRTAAADCKDTAYSVEHPPNNTKIRFRSSLHIQKAPLRHIYFNTDRAYKTALCPVPIAYQNRALSFCREAFDLLTVFLQKSYDFLAAEAVAG